MIPTMSQSDETPFDFCFKGVEKGLVVAVSTYMFHEHNYHSDQKDVFMNGYNRMLQKIKPSKIICYSEPFDELKGDIIYIDYELSSWKYLNKSDNVTENYVKYTNPALTFRPEGYIIKTTCFVCKGGGSAFGGTWRPKDKNSERFLGEPNSQRMNIVKTTKGQYRALDQYDKHGRAVRERHFSNHTRPDKHSDPHDHIVSWDDNHPDLSGPINYFDGNVPEFKRYHMEVEMMENTNDYNNDYNPEEHKFETLGEFKFYLSCGANVGFEWHGVEYGIEGHNNSFDIWIAYQGDIANGLTLEQTLDYELDGVKIKDLILKATITERIL